MNKRSSVVLVGLLFLPLLGWARSEGHFDRTLQVSGAVALDVSTGSGDIMVKTGSSNQVVIHGRVRRSNTWVFGDDSAVQKVESNPPIEQSGSSIRLGYNLPDDVKRHISIDYEVTVPPDTALQAHSGSGNIAVAGVRSQVEAQTGSGDVRLSDIGSKVHAQTGSGNIHAETVAAPFWAQTGSGDIEAYLTGSGDVDVHTGSGTIRVRGINGGVRARAGSGNVETDGAVAGPWQLHSGSGNIALAVGAGNGFNLDVHTSSGSIHSDLPIAVQGSFGRHQLKGIVKGGGPEVDVSTGSGDVEIR
jgi:putative adhesin